MNGKECHTNMSKNCNEKLNEPSFWVLDPVWPSFGGVPKRGFFFCAEDEPCFLGMFFQQCLYYDRDFYRVFDVFFDFLKIQIEILLILSIFSEKSFDGTCT